MTSLWFEVGNYNAFCEGLPLRCLRDNDPINLVEIGNRTKCVGEVFKDKIIGALIATKGYLWWVIKDGTEPVLFFPITLKCRTLPNQWWILKKARAFFSNLFVLINKRYNWEIESTFWLKVLWAIEMPCAMSDSVKLTMEKTQKISKEKKSYYYHLCYIF